MAQHVEAKLVVLWANEIRVAVRALKRMSDLAKDDAPQDEYVVAVNDALRACWAALYDATIAAGDAPIVVCEVPLGNQKRKHD